MRSSSVLTMIILAAACAGASGRAPAGPIVADTAPPPRAVSEWRNPGGMWLPQQIPAQTATLRALGIEIDPASLADPTRFPLGAIVALGGCSASFVSPDGLIVTNHHCVQGALAYVARPEHDVIESGFV